MNESTPERINPAEVQALVNASGHIQEHAEIVVRALHEAGWHIVRRPMRRQARGI